MTKTAKLYGGSLYDLAADEKLTDVMPVSYTHLDVYKRQYFARAGSSGDHGARALEHHFNPGLCRLAGSGPPGAGECAEPTPEQLCKKQRTGRNEPPLYPFFRDPSKYDGPDPGVRNLGYGPVHEMCIRDSILLGHPRNQDRD